MRAEARNRKQAETRETEKGGREAGRERMQVELYKVKSKRERGNGERRFPLQAFAGPPLVIGVMQNNLEM